MLKINKSIQINATSNIGEIQVVYMSANVNTEGGSNATKSINILNQELYNKNKIEIRKDMSDFDAEVFKVEDEIMGGSKDE